MGILNMSTLKDAAHFEQIELLRVAAHVPMETIAATRSKLKRSRNYQEFQTLLDGPKPSSRVRISRSSTPNDSVGDAKYVTIYEWFCIMSRSASIVISPRV